MFPRTGEWFLAHGMMDPVMVKQVLQFQQHGDHRKFGEIALRWQMVNGRAVKEYLRDLRLHS